MEQHLSVNLRRLRRARKITQVELAKAAGLSRGGYRRIETGVSEPRSETLQALAEALGVTLGDLVRPVAPLHRVRFRSFRRLRMRDEILAEVAVRLTNFKQLEEILEDWVSCTLDSLRAVGDGGDASGPGASTPKAAAERSRRAFGLEPREPVRDICGLLEANGVKVLPLQIASDAFFGLSVVDEDLGPAVAVNTWERISVERWIYTAAHELGHLVLHLADYEVDHSEEERLREKEANLFASHFLMPDAVFWDEWQETCGMGLVDRVLKVKRMFRVSYKTVLYRLSERMEDRSQIWKIFQIQYQRRYGRALFKADEPAALAADAFRASFPESARSEEPEDLSPADFMEDRLSRLVRRATEAGEISLARAAEILRLSLPEMRDLATSWVGP